MVEDIVSSAWQHVAVREDGTSLTNLCEDIVVFFGWLALAIAGVLLQVFASFGNLIGDQVVEAVDNGLIAK